MAPETTLRTGSQKGRGSSFNASCKPLCVVILLIKWHKSFYIAPPPLFNPIGASEISDACKPLKKRSRASTDVEMASSQYRDTSDSDSRGLNDPQVGRCTEIPTHTEENTVFLLHTKFINVHPEAKILLSEIFAFIYAFSAMKRTQAETIS